MLKGTSHKPDESRSRHWIGRSNAEVTVERVATCAVMPVPNGNIFGDPRLANHVPFGNSTSSMANIIVVNGPIRDEIGMNYGTNVMGPHK